MGKINDEIIELDNKLFDYIARAYKTRNYTKKFVDQVSKFIISTDPITGCMLIAAMTHQLCMRVAENDKVVSQIGRFLRVHTSRKTYGMLAVRYKEDFRRLELRMDTRDYAGLMDAFERGLN